MLAEDQQQDEKLECERKLGEDLHPPPVVNAEGSEDLLARHISREKKTLFWLPVIVQDRNV